MESPTQFHFWTGVATLAGALKRRVWISNETFDWTPNFYIIMVAPPGIAAKTTTIGIGAELLREVPGVKFGPDVISWQRLVECFAEAQELIALPDALQNPMDKQYYPMSSVSFFTGEFGTFYDPSSNEMTDILVTLWDSKRGPISKETKTRGNDRVDTPCPNIIGCTTPAMIRARFPSYFIHGGMASRCIFIYGNMKRNLVAYPGRTKGREHRRELKEKLTEDLIHVSELFGEYDMTPEAIAWGEEWYTKLWTGDDSENLQSPNFAGYKSRKQTHIHKLAMILACAKRDELIITADDLQTAHKLITSVEPQMAQVFEFIGMSEDTRGVGEVLETVRLAKRISRRELYRRLHMTLSVQQFRDALQGAIDTGNVSMKIISGEQELMWVGAAEVQQFG